MSSNQIVKRLISPPSSHWNCYVLFSRFGSSVKSICTKSSISSSGGLCTSPPHRCVPRSDVNTHTSLFGINASPLTQTFNNNGRQCSNFRNFHRTRIASERFIIQKENCRPASFQLVVKDGMLSLHGGDQEMSCLPLIWLRDHCRCPSCYNPDTNQKENIDVDLLDEDKTDVHKVSLEDGDRSLVVHWKDGHTSNYSVDWLVSNSYRDTVLTPKIKRVLWTGATIKDEGSPLPVSYASHVDTEEGLRQTLRNLVEYGFSMITEAPATLEGNKTATDRVAPIQETFYGGMWQFTSDGAFSDTAYSTGYLSAHTDTTYLEMPAGIQVFQCLGHDGNGGETLLVDGFQAVEQLRHSYPDAVRCLTNHLVPHEYKESPDDKDKVDGSPGYHMYTMCPVIGLHPTTGEVVHLRYNPYDRAPLNTIPPGDMMDFYRSYQLLSTIIADPKGHHWVKLTPGTILLIDNWRVMHGRAAFDGRRIMSGCYLRRDDWMSKVRVMGLGEV